MVNPAQHQWAYILDNDQLAVIFGPLTAEEQVERAVRQTMLEDTKEKIYNDGEEE